MRGSCVARVDFDVLEQPFPVFFLCALINILLMLIALYDSVFQGKSPVVVFTRMSNIVYKREN